MSKSKSLLSMLESDSEDLLKSLTDDYPNPPWIRGPNNRYAMREISSREFDLLTEIDDMYPVSIGVQKGAFYYQFTGEVRYRNPDPRYSSSTYDNYTYSYNTNINARNIKKEKTLLDGKYYLVRYDHSTSYIYGLINGTDLSNKLDSLLSTPSHKWYKHPIFVELSNVLSFIDYDEDSFRFGNKDFRVSIRPDEQGEAQMWINSDLYWRDYSLDVIKNIIEPYSEYKKHSTLANAEYKKIVKEWNS